MSLLFNELTKNYLETNAIMYDVSTSTNYCKMLSCWFTKGVSIIIKQDDFDEFLSNIKLNNMKEINTKLFTATGISSILPTLIEYKFPIASAISTDIDFNIFTIQPKMALLDTCHLLRSGANSTQKNPLTKVLTPEEIIQAELEFLEAIKPIAIKYTAIIDTRLLLID
jgi:hypothetical protein